MSNKRRVCVWAESDEGNWDTACGEYFSFLEGGPIENKAKFCQYCGVEIEPVSYKEDIEEEEDL